MLTLEERINDVVESTIASVKEVLHIPYTVDGPFAYNERMLRSDMCVLVGFNGETEGRLLIDGDAETFRTLGTTMFGIGMDGDILDSFVGEIVNMIAGNICTILSRKGRRLNITPPTILMGEMMLFGFEKGFSFPVDIANVGELNILLLIQEKKVG